jgi:acyl carrier protein
MNDDEIRRLVVRALLDVAPEVEAEKIDPRKSLREELDLDSVDFMNFVVAIHASLGVDVPESDYDQLSSLDDCVAYVAARRRN